MGLVIEYDVIKEPCTKSKDGGQMRKRAASKNLKVHEYIDMLVDAGTLRSGDQEYGQIGYDSAFCITGKEKARNIGRNIYAQGGHSLMLEVAYATVDRMGDQVRVELDYCWNGIGQWQS